MKAIILLHFGSPRNKKEVSLLIRSIFDDPVFSPFKNNIFLKLLKKPIEMYAVRSATKKYKSIDFDRTYLSGMETLRKTLSKNLGPGEPVFIAAHYGAPSMEEVFEQMEDANAERAVIMPFYPHASTEMYGSIVTQTQNLKRGFFTNIHLKWTSPFFDHPLFIQAWANSIRESLNKFRLDEQKDVHILFCAHAHPVFDLIENKNMFDSYEAQVEATSRAVWKSLGSQNPMSIAYQSAARFGKWSTPALEEELKRLISQGVSNCIIASVSFLFDNMETLLDIDSIAIPGALRGGMKKVLKASSPGERPEITGMLVDMISRTEE